MALISAVLQDEEGNAISERIDLPKDLLPRPDDTRFLCLRFVDPYGDTLFNRLQAPAVVQDLRLLGTGVSSSNHQSVVERLQALASRCQRETHSYLRFIGD